jgi:hypothetical protein
MDNNLEILDKLSQRKYKSDSSIPTQNIVFTINEKTIGTLQSFVCFQGLPKQGKTLYVTSAIASAYCYGDMFGMKLNFPQGRERLCYIDTESSDYDYYINLTRIQNLMNRNCLPENFDSFLFREDEPAEIKKMIEIYLQHHPDCSILVIDGVLDLISDFNSVEQSFYLVQWLKKLTKHHDLLVVLVLHLGKKEQNSIGHIGSYLDRKSQSVLKIEKNKETRTFDLSPIFLRSSDDFNPVQIMYANGMIIQYQQNESIKDHSVYGMDKIFLLNKVLIEPCKYTTLLDSIAEITGKGKTTIKKLLKEWIATGEIIKIGDKYQQKKRGI